MTEPHEKKPRNHDEYRGSALARAIEDRAYELKLTQKEIAKRLEMSDAYFTLLLSGDRWFGSLAKEKLANIARFLEMPVISVYMLAEVIVNTDWHGRAPLEEGLNNAYKTMSKDKRYTMCLPPLSEWNKAHISVKMTIVMMYQELSNKHFLSDYQLLNVVHKFEDSTTEKVE